MTTPLQNLTLTERAQEITEDLRGTCLDLGEIATEAERNCPAILEMIDAEIFQCDTCGWWFDDGEQGEDGETCGDCFDNAEELL